MKPVVFKRLLAAALALAGVWLLLLRQPGVWPGADGWLLGALAVALALWARQRCMAVAGHVQIGRASCRERV